MEPAGFLLIDSLFRPVYANAESIKILGYPNNLQSVTGYEGVLAQRIRSFLPRRVLPPFFVTQFQSGKRWYFCRAFTLHSDFTGGSHETRIALLFERGLNGPPGDLAEFGNRAGVCADPFGFSPDPRYFFPGRAHQDALASLRRLVCEDGGIGVLVAQSGMGKTVLLNYLREKICGHSDVAFLPCFFEGHVELLRAVLATLRVDSPGNDLEENLQALRVGLLEKSRSGRKIVIICDEAQSLDADTLENVCRLGELVDPGTAQQKVVRIILAGRQGLLERISGAEACKVRVLCRLFPLDESEIRSYILHRLRIAGSTRQLFSSAALYGIALYSRGIPLNVNMLCRHSLSLARALGLGLVDESMVADSAYDLVLRAQPTRVSESRRVWPEYKMPPDLRRPAGNPPCNRTGLRLVKKD